VCHWQWILFVLAAKVLFPNFMMHLLLATTHHYFIKYNCVSRSVAELSHLIKLLERRFPGHKRLQEFFLTWNSYCSLLMAKYQQKKRKTSKLIVEDRSIRILFIFYCFCQLSCFVVCLLVHFRLKNNNRFLTNIGKIFCFISW